MGTFWTAAIIAKTAVFKRRYPLDKTIDAIHRSEDEAEGNEDENESTIAVDMLADPSEKKL